MNLSGFGQLHEAVAGSAFPVAGRTVAGNITVLAQAFDNFHRRAVIADSELWSILLVLIDTVGTHASS
ncbi:hypothetical protein D3C81_2206040 [compost metagenome]